MYCVQCGYKLSDESRFCSRCGARVRTFVEPSDEKNSEELIGALENDVKEETINTDTNETDGETEAVVVSEAVDRDCDCVPAFDANCEYVEYVEETPFDEKGTKNHFSRIGVTYMLYALISYLTAQFLVIALNYVSPGIYGEIPELRVILSIVAIYGLAFLVLLLFTRFIGREPIAQKRNISVKVWLLYLVVGIGVMGLGSQISTVVESFVDAIINGASSVEIDNIYAEGNIFLTAAYTVIIAPIGEEFVFRKLIIDRTRKFGGPICIILSAMMFGLMHGNLGQAIPAFGAGLVLGYLYYRYGRLLPCIFVHAGINLYSTINSLLLAGIDEEFMMMPSIEGLIENGFSIVGLLFMGMVTLACITTAIALPIILRKKIVFDAPKAEIPRGKRFKTVVLNVGVILMLIVYFAEIIIYYI